MAAPALSPSALARIEAGGAVRDLTGDPRFRVLFDRSCGGLRTLQLRAEPWELGEGSFPFHLAVLNLGPETECEADLAGRGWKTHRLPLQGVGLIPARLPHAVRSRSPSDLLLVLVEPEFAAAALAGGRGALRALPPEPDGFAAHAMLALAEEARAPGPAARVRVEALGVVLVTHLVERERPGHGRSLPVATLPSAKLRRVLDYVSLHLDAPLSLQRLADLAEMDVYRFVRAFKQSTGSSPHRYILEARIARARELLRDTSLPITEVALRTGFATPSHFSVTFRRLVHVTPRRYREGRDPT